MPRPNGRKTREYVRTIGIHVGPHYVRGSMRVQVRKSTVARSRRGRNREEEKEEARPKVKPNSFSVRLEAADLSAVPYHESLFRGLPRSAFSLFMHII